MNRRSIRDHRRIPFRFRFTGKQGEGVTAWPQLPRDPATGKQSYNPAVHVAAVITRSGVTEKVNKNKRTATHAV